MWRGGSSLTTLFSYRVRYDDGAAPNPFWGICTLTICKPVIRRTAEEGDWIAGTGAVTSDLRDAENRLVYAMRVTRKLSMKQYDAYTSEHLHAKVPDLQSTDQRRWVGDSIYDFSVEPPRLRSGVHTEQNRETDLGGVNALLSGHFLYFGRKAISLPKDLRPIIKRGQGHKSRANDAFVSRFEDWISSLGYEFGTILGDPIAWPPELENIGACSGGRRVEACQDEGLL